MRALPPALAVLLALLLASPAGAVIVPQQGIGGVKLKMTRAQVVAVKGKPKHEKVVGNEIIGRQRKMFYDGVEVSFGGASASAGVVTLQTFDHDERTRSGVGPGSTISELKAAIPGLKCEFIHCWKGRFLPGRRVTDFMMLPNDEVISVTVGFVID